MLCGKSINFSYLFCLAIKYKEIPCGYFTHSPYKLVVIYNLFLYGSRGWLRCCLTRTSFCLNNDEVVTALRNYFNSAFLKDESTKNYERYVNLDRYYKDSSMKMKDYLQEFEKLYNRINQKEMTLPSPVLAFKILGGIKLKHCNR